MVTNKKFKFYRLLTLICVMLFSFSSFGQDFEITGLKFNDVIVEKAIIKYLLETTDTVKTEEVQVGRKFPTETQITALDNTKISVLTPDGHTGHLSSGAKFYLSKDGGKQIKVMKGEVVFSNESQNKKEGKLSKFKNYLKDKFSLFGGRSKGVQGAVEGTKFTVESIGDNLKIYLINGGIAINKRRRVILNEKFIDLESVPKRELFITETIDHLTIKNRLYDKKLDSLQDIVLETDVAIENFFKDQFRNQKRVLSNRGASSNDAFKLMEEGKDSLGIAKYQEAIENGEINRDEFIQAALILTEAYYRNNILKNRAVWLESAIYFIEQEHNSNTRKYKHFKSAGEDEGRLGFGNDLVVTKEYFAWAYAVKLKLNGCLEEASQNPQKWLSDASKLKDSLN